MRCCGALHIHSTCSDGEFTLRELREIFAAAGCAFACLADHAESFDTDRLRAYVRECESLSDERFQVIAGLEYSCRERMHVLGYGVTSRVATLDPEVVIRHIEREGGVSVIAHPLDTAFPWIETFRALPHGIEAWNSKYDGRYAPRPGTFRLLERLQARKPELHAFYGQDLHWKTQFRGLFTLVRCEAPARAAVLAALARGDYCARKGDLELPANGRLPEPLLARFGSLHARSDRMRRFITRVKQTADRVGATVPAPLKAQVRRIF
jgi:hypothetical protein